MLWHPGVRLAVVKPPTYVMMKDFSVISWQFTANLLCWSPFFQIEDIMADRPQKAREDTR